MKTAIALLALVAVAQAGVLAPLATGASTVSRSEDGLGNYAFAYKEAGATGGTSRQEHGSPGVVKGSYSLQVADGRVRTVNYIADALGFRAAISTNEPGVEAKNPADVSINGVVAAIAAAPLIAAAAPVFAGNAYAGNAYAGNAYAGNAYAGHAYAAAPLAYAAVAPQATSYSSSVNHAVAARVAIAAPLAVAHAPLAYAAVAPQASSYSSSVNHAVAARVAIAAPLAVAHAPLAYAAAAPAAISYSSSVNHLAAPAYAAGHLAAPALAYGGIKGAW